MWDFDVVMSRYSFSSSSNKNELLAAMFSDSEVARAFSCGKTKCSCLVNHAIGSYFTKLLSTRLKELKHFVSLFDESHNNVGK